VPYWEPVDDDVLTAAELQADVADQVISQVTSATNPSGAAGQKIYETDTRRFKAYDAADGWRDFGATGGWRTWTPTIDAVTTDPTLGNGTASGFYMMIGTIGFFSFKIVWGSTSTFGSGEWRLTLPAGVETDNSFQHEATGTVWCHDASAPAADVIVLPVVSTTDPTLMRFRPHEATASLLSPTVPFTWASTDNFVGGFWVPLAYT
jgi:hypothetical protein